LPKRVKGTTKKQHRSSMITGITAGRPGQRWIAGTIDLMLLVSIHTIIAGLFQRDPFFFEIAISYFTDISLIPELILGPVGLTNIFVLFLIAFPYFLIEGILGVSIGKYLMNLRIAGSRTIQRVAVRSFVKSILPLSFVDFIGIYKNRMYNQRFIDKNLQLSVAELPYSKKSKLILIGRTDIRYIIAGIILWVIPMLSFLLNTTLNSNYVSPVTAPDPSISFDYVPTLDILSSILINNSYLSYVYYGFGGLFLCIPMLMQIYFQGFMGGVMISGILTSNLSFFAYGMLPHFIFEIGGFSVCIGSGLVISETIMNLISNYFQGMSLDFNRTYFAEQVKRILKLAFWGLILLLIAAVIETYLTPIILSNYYFH